MYGFDGTVQASAGIFPDADISVPQCSGSKKSSTSAATSAIKAGWLEKKSYKVTNKKMTSLEQNVVKFVGTNDHPKWNIYDAKRGDQLITTVSCPCVGLKDVTMSFDEAKATILGQLAAIGIPEKVKCGRRRWFEVAWNARIALAAINMVNCWHKKCKCTDPLVFVC